jgi:hypothetical protein
LALITAWWPSPQPSGCSPVAICVAVAVLPPDQTGSFAFSAWWNLMLFSLPQADHSAV